MRKAARMTSKRVDRAMKEQPQIDLRTESPEGLNRVVKSARETDLG